VSSANPERPHKVLLLKQAFRIFVELDQLDQALAILEELENQLSQQVHASLVNQLNEKTLQMNLKNMKPMNLVSILAHRTGCHGLAS
jgi:hypothetical protein